MGSLKQKYLQRLPDIPRWVETRALLSCKESVVIENATRDGFVVWSEDDGIGAVVGQPDFTALARAADDVSELLAFKENITSTSTLLAHFHAEHATVFVAPPDLAAAQEMPAPSNHLCRQIEPNELNLLAHLPPVLLKELTDVLEDDAPVMAAFAGALPVSFAYVASETETLWDVSIDTVESHRRMGYAASAVMQLVRMMQKKGKTAVWGALESNLASSNLARRLGFIEADELWVLTFRTN